MKRTRRSLLMIRAWANDPARRRRASRRMKRCWRDPVFRQQRVEAAKLRMQSPETRRRISIALKRLWRDRRRRERMAAVMRRQWRDPTYRRLRVEHMKGRWRTPEHRRAVSRAVRRLWRSPVHRKRMARMMRRLWRDPKTRPKMLRAARGALGPSPGALKLHRVLGDGWFLEFWTPHGPIDLANPTKQLAVEVDGPEHRKPKQQRHDRRKERRLRSEGWTVLRVPERRCRRVEAVHGLTPDSATGFLRWLAQPDGDDL